MLAEFLRGLIRHWFALVGGTVIAVGLLFWQVYGGPVMPKSVFVTIITGAILVAAFLAWRDEHRQALELHRFRAMKPKAMLKTVVEDHDVFCEVRNDGAQGNFAVRLHGANIANVVASWEGPDHVMPRMIGRGQTHRLHVANLFHSFKPSAPDDGECEWKISYEHGGTRRSLGLGLGSVHATEPFDVTVVVVTEPESEPVSKRVTVNGFEVADDELVKVRITPRPPFTL